MHAPMCAFNCSLMFKPIVARRIHAELSLAPVQTKRPSTAPLGISSFSREEIKNRRGNENFRQDGTASLSVYSPGSRHISLANSNNQAKGKKRVIYSLRTSSVGKRPDGGSDSDPPLRPHTAEGRMEANQLIDVRRGGEYSFLLVNGKTW